MSIIIIGGNKEPVFSTSEDIFTFGKYKGESLKAVLECDPAYVHWCRENIDGFELRGEALSLSEQMLGFNSAWEGMDWRDVQD
jgi:hypothetical protein